MAHARAPECLCPGSGNRILRGAPRARARLLLCGHPRKLRSGRGEPCLFQQRADEPARLRAGAGDRCACFGMAGASPTVERTSVVEGKSVSVRVDLGGRRIIKKKTLTQQSI